MKERDAGNILTCPDGHEVRADVSFCTTCGIALQRESEARATESTLTAERRAPRRRPIELILGTVLAVLLIGVGVGFVLTRSADDGVTAADRRSSEVAGSERSVPTDSAVTTEAVPAPPPPTSPSTVLPQAPEPGIGPFGDCRLGEPGYPVAEGFELYVQGAQCALDAWRSGNSKLIAHFSTPEAADFFMREPIPTDTLHVEGCYGNTAIWCEVLDDASGLGYSFGYTEEVPLSPEGLPRVAGVEPIT